MKKLILATVAFAFIASPALASKFDVIQAQMIDLISSYMELYKDDTKKMDFLTQKKVCMEKAVDTEDLKTCLSKFPTTQLIAQVK